MKRKNETRLPRKAKRKAVATTETIAHAPPLIGALRIRDAASYLGGISVITVRALVKRGLLRPSRGTRHLIFSLVELDRYLKETMTG